MKTRGKIIALVGVVAVMIVGSVVYGVMASQNAKGQFSKDGYILGNIKTNDSGQTDSSYYFSAGSTYQKKYPNKIIFDKKDGKKVTTESKNFVHFMNDDIEAFAKGVFLDMDSLDNEALAYYNIPAENLMQRQGDGYSVHTSAQEQQFKNLVWKTDQSKYMVVSNTVKLHLAEGSEKTLEGYVEINYVDKDVVQLVHRDGVYQTVAEDAYVELQNKSRLYLATRAIVYNDEEKLTLAQLIIDSDDNIEVIDKKQETQVADADKETKPAAGGNSSSNNQSNNQQNIIGGGGSGGGNGSGGSGEENNEEDTEAAFPNFAITDFNSDTVSVSATIEITDDDGMLSEKGIDFSIIESGSNKVISKQHKEGVFDVRYGYDGLSPDTEYTLIANSDYTYKDVTYNKDFISYVFRTDGAGVSIKKKMATEDAVSVWVNVDNYSTMTSGVLHLYKSDDMNQEVAQQDVDFVEIKASGGKKGFDFSSLDSNTNYTVVLGSLSAGAISLNSLEQSKDIMTLKKMPVIGTPDYSINQAQSAFSLFLKKVGQGEGGADPDLGPIVDEDNGVKSLVFEIYNTTQLKGGALEGNPVKTITTDKSTSVEASVNDTVLMRNTSYCYRVVVKFNDNEKDVEFYSAVSAPFKLSTAKYPSVTFRPDETKTEGGVIIQGIAHDRFTGTVMINDDSNVMVMSNNMITMSIVGNDGGKAQVRRWDLNGGPLYTALEVTGLRANTTYTVSLRGKVNLGDPDNPDDMEVYLGSFQVTTGTPNKIQANVTSTQTPSLTQAFDVNFQLSQLKDKGGNTVNNYYEMTTANNIQLELYEGEGTSGTLWGTKLLMNTNQVTDPQSYTYNSTIKADYCDKSLLITPETFGKTNTNVTSTVYTLVVKPADDYTDNGGTANKIQVVKEGEAAAQFTIVPHGFVPSLPADPDNAIKVTPIMNSDTKNSAGQDTYAELKYDENLRSDTVVGFEAFANTYPRNGMTYATKVTYKAWRISGYDGSGKPIYDTSGTPVATQTINVESDADSLPKWVVPVGGKSATTGLKRGNQYFFTYEVELNLSPAADQPTIASYPKDAANGTGKVLRSPLQSCQKEMPTMAMYLKNMTGTSSFTQVWNYNYTDVDGAYTTDGFIIYLNGAKQTTQPAFTGNTFSIGSIPVNRTVEIRKGVALFEPIVNYPSATIEDVLATQDTVATLSPTQMSNFVAALPFRMDYDASNLKVVLDQTYLTKDATNIACAAALGGLKVEVALKDTPTTKKTFDYVPLASDGTASIPLASLLDFMGQDLIVNASAYYDTGLMGTDMTSNNHVFLLRYSRTGKYGYLSGRASGSLYRVDSSFVSSIFGSANKSFSAAKLYNNTGLENYTPEAATPYSYSIDKQGMNTSAAAKTNPDTDTYYIFRQADVKPVASKDISAKFDYVRPTVSNIKVTPSLDGAKVDFNYNGVSKSSVIGDKLYMQFTDASGVIKEDGKVYEVPLNGKTSGAFSVDLSEYQSGQLMTSGTTYYVTITADFKATPTSPQERLRLLNTDTGDKPVLIELTTASHVDFGKVTYRYQHNSYNSKQMIFQYSPSFNKGYDLTLQLKDLTTGEMVDLGDQATIAEGQISTKMTTTFNVGRGYASSGTPEWHKLIYGNQYELTGTAKTPNGDNVGTFTCTFKLAELDSPFFTVTSVASVDSGQDSIKFNVLATDLNFSMVNEQYAVRVYEGDKAEGTPLLNRTYSLPVVDGKHQSKDSQIITLGGSNSDAPGVVLKKDTAYTLRVSANVDKKYKGEDFVTASKTYTTRTLNDYGVAYDKAYAVPVISGGNSSLRLDFYDTVGFSNIKDLQYTIYPSSATGTPVSGVVEGVRFTQGSSNELSVLLPQVLNGQDTGSYTIRIYLVDTNGVTAVEDDLDFSYSTNTVLNQLFQLLN